MSDQPAAIPAHHTKQEYCETRPKYRRGNKKTAVRVFTVNLESKYLIVSGVPATGLEKDLVKLFSSYGMIHQYKELQDYPKEDFTQVYLIQYRDIQAAKTAKKFLDEHYFYGAMLHVFYAPELETVADTREKIVHRRQSVISRVKYLEREEKQKTKHKLIKKLHKSQKKVKDSKPHEKATNSSPPLSNSNIAIKQQDVVTQVPQTFRFPYIQNSNIPTNSFGVPLYLPPPPVENTFFPYLRNVRQSFQNKGLNNPLPMHNATSSNTTEHTSSSVTERKKPQFKRKSGYFHQKVIDMLKTKPLVSVSGKATPQIHSKIPIQKPSLLPRHIELKQIEEINKIDRNADGSIPLLGSFIHKPGPNQSTKS